eukprot:Phypoly_transcript_01373.p1 GENE.Phypoly_transcript_01373~~Phypoly_transcript_01373.p1  ORF type:complete len:313 (-),score=44.44 Phypoly_transcript_01373:1808-2746(-)
MVRVFLSSTFVDMHQEREIIMRKVMVALNKYCYQRGVTLTYIDMRWGITSEMVNNQSLTIVRCLQEVDNSRPYFVCTIGQRYGWHQEQVGKDALLTSTFKTAEQDFAWISNYQTKSVTELEIRSGFLLHPYPSLPKGHSFFYLRDRSFLSTIAPDKLQGWAESQPYPQEKLKELIAEIKKEADKGTCLLREYQKPDDLETILLADLKAAIDRDFPLLPETESLLNRYHFEHENYAHQLCTVYVPRPSHMQTLEKQTLISDGASGNFVMVTGESGSGKSALLANWEQQEKAKSHRIIFVHFVGALFWPAAFPP